MGIWQSVELDWTVGTGRRAFQLFQHAYGSPEALSSAAATAGVDVTSLAGDRAAAGGFRVTLTLVAAQGKLPALAAVLLHDATREVFHPPLCRLLGDDLPVVQAELQRLFGVPSDATYERTGARAARVPSAAFDRVHSAGRSRTALIRRGPESRLGTGFLVGPDLLLTSAHLFGMSLPERGPLTELEAVFDLFDETLIPSEAGVRVPITEFLDGQLPPDGEDRRVSDRALPVADDRLDYALLRLARPIGTEVGLGDVARGWYELRAIAYDYRGAGPLILYGFPADRAQQTAFTTSEVTPNGNATRVWYATDTDPGSSGSPLVDVRGTLAAIHQYRQDGPQGHRGVVIARVAAALADHGFADQLNQQVPAVAVARGGAMATPCVAVGEPDPFETPLVLGEQPLIDRAPLRRQLSDLALAGGRRTLIISGVVDSGVSTSYEIVDHATTRATAYPPLVQVAPGGLRSYRLDLRAYLTTPVAEIPERVMTEVYRFVEGNKPSRKKVAQNAKEVSDFRLWARNAFLGDLVQWWIFVDSIDPVGEGSVQVDVDPVDEVIRVLLALTQEAQVNLRVVLAGRDEERLIRLAGPGRRQDQALGIERSDVRDWLVQRGERAGAPLAPPALEAELDRLFPPGSGRDPTWLRFEIADAARRLWP